MDIRIQELFPLYITSPHPQSQWYYAPKGASVGRSFEASTIGFGRSGLSISIGARAVGNPKRLVGSIARKETVFIDFCK